MGFKSKNQLHSSIKALIATNSTSFFSYHHQASSSKAGISKFWAKLEKQGRRCAFSKGRACLLLALHAYVLHCVPALCTARLPKRGNACLWHYAPANIPQKFPAMPPNFTKSPFRLEQWFFTPPKK